MKDLTELETYRVKTPEVLERYGSYGDGTSGVFNIPYPASTIILKTIASSDGGWDHVSVSLPFRTPDWYEMRHIHRTFFKPNEIAWEYHVPPVNHINIMPNCLHLWRKHNFIMPLPPSVFV
jgi:hypothetical protein